MCCQRHAYVWPIDGGPAGNVHRRDVVGKPREAADHALENGLRGTVMLVDTATSGAGARRVAGVHQGHQHTRASGFVADLLAQMSVEWILGVYGGSVLLVLVVMVAATAVTIIRNRRR